MTGRPLAEDSFAVPDVFVAGEFRLELLGPQHNVADHAAWMPSIEHIRSTPGFDHGWPPAAGMTLAENLADLEQHAERSARRVDFAYSVIEVATGDVVGCVYFKPSPATEGEVLASSWVCAARAELDGPLTDVVGAWLLQAWPFEVVHYRDPLPAGGGERMDLALGLAGLADAFGADQAGALQTGKGQHSPLSIVGRPGAPAEAPAPAQAAD